MFKKNDIDGLNSKSYLEKYFDNNSGLCAGFSLLWLTCMMNTFSKNSNQYNSFMDPSFDQMEILTLEWFHSSTKKIMESYKENVEKNTLLQNKDLDKYIKLVQKLFKVGNTKLRHDNFFALKVANKNVLNSKLAEFISSISRAVKDHLCLYIGTYVHAMAIYLQKHENYLRIYFYDSNLKKGEYGFNIPLNGNVEQIIAQNIDFTKSSALVAGNNLCVFIFAFDKNTLNTKVTLEDSSINPIKLLKYNNWKSDPILASQALIFLSAFNNYFLVKYLLKYVPQIDPNLEETGVGSSLVSACQNGNVEIVRELLKHPNIDVHQPGMLGMLPLQVATVQQNTYIIKELLNTSKVNPNAVNLARPSPLSSCSVVYIAVWKRNSKILALLLSHENKGKKIKRPQCAIS